MARCSVIRTAQRRSSPFFGGHPSARVPVAPIGAATPVPEHSIASLRVFSSP